MEGSGRRAVDGACDFLPPEDGGAVRVTLRPWEVVTARVLR